MAKTIIYPKEDNSLAFMGYIPTESTALQTARKFVPVGTPFLIIEESDFPHSDIDFIDAFEADFNNPDGYGIGKEAWQAEFEADCSIAEPEIKQTSEVE